MASPETPSSQPHRTDPDVTARRVALGAAASALSLGARLGRAVGGPLADAWKLPPAAPARRLTSGVIDAAAARGEREEARIAARTEAEIDVLVERALQSPALERNIVQVLESEMLDDVVDRVLASEELRRVVAHIAESEEVRMALTRQSMGLVDEVAGSARTRTVRADALAERVARSILRRRPAPWSEEAAPPPDEPAAPR
jgi:hypothetical protein